MAFWADFNNQGWQTQTTVLNELKFRWITWTYSRSFLYFYLGKQFMNPIRLRTVLNVQIERPQRGVDQSDLFWPNCNIEGLMQRQSTMREDKNVTLHTSLFDIENKESLVKRITKCCIESTLHKISHTRHYSQKMVSKKVVNLEHHASREIASNCSMRHKSIA